MRFLHQLGPFVWIFGAMVLLMAVRSVQLAVLRARGPWDPRERSIAISLTVLAIGFPLVGLLGTVLGLRRAFASVASASPDVKSTLLSEGISAAMSCTAAGLGLLLPALIVAVIALATGAKRAPKKQPPPASG